MFLFWPKESYLTILIDSDYSIIRCYFSIIDHLLFFFGLKVSICSISFPFGASSWKRKSLSCYLRTGYHLRIKIIIGKTLFRYLPNDLVFYYFYYTTLILGILLLKITFQVSLLFLLKFMLLANLEQEGRLII